jgi:hypothetical protein
MIEEKKRKGRKQVKVEIKAARGMRPERYSKKEIVSEM